MSAGSTARELLDLDAIEAEARDHRRITDVGRHVLQLVSEVRRLRAEVAELERLQSVADDLSTAAERCTNNDAVMAAVRAYDAVREGRA